MKLSQRKLALVLGLGATMVLGACASIGPPLPPSLELPSPPTDLRAARKGAVVTLTWTVPTQTTDRKTVRSLGRTRVCRGLDPVLKQCGALVGEAAAATAKIKSGDKGVQATYVDTLSDQLERDHALEFATYAVEVPNASGRGAGLSNQVRVPLAPTLSPPRDFAAQVSAQGVVLAWTGEASPPSQPQRRYLYRIYRRPEGSQQGILVGELPVAGEAKITLADRNIEWEKTYYYRANVTTAASPQGGPEVHVEGDDTREVEVFAHDIFPPGVPTGVQAVYSGPGQQPFIDLIWEPVADVDLAGYNVYRRQREAAPVKINAEVIKIPAYRDADVTAGKTYGYSVSSVDVRGNESAPSEEASERVP
jgi:hypothetical protein